MTEPEFSAELVERCQRAVFASTGNLLDDDQSKARFAAYAVLRAIGYAELVEALELSRQCIFEDTWREETRMRLLARIDAALKAAGKKTAHATAAAKARRRDRDGA